MKILQLCHKMPYPPLDGGAQAIYYTTCGLVEKGMTLKVCAINTPKKWINPNLLPDKFRTSAGFEFACVDTRIKPVNIAINLFKKESYFIERFDSSSFRSLLVKVLSMDKFDIIQLEHLYLCIYINLILKYSDAAIVLRPQNIEHLIWEQYSRNILNPITKILIRVANKRLKNFEKNIANKVKGIIAITPDDAAVFRSFDCNVPVIHIPMGYDFGNLKNYNVEKQYKNFPQFYHLASMDWLPNREGLEWFMKNILPGIIILFPDIRIHIAGNNMPDWAYMYAGANINVSGEVSKPLLFQEDKAVMYVPLLSGSGIRAKIVEGMALGKTIITTTVGAQGIPYTDNVNILIANTPDEFVKQTEKCIRSENFCRFIGNNAKKLAEENFNYLSCAEKMISFYKCIAGSRP